MGGIKCKKLRGMGNSKSGRKRKSPALVAPGIIKKI